MIKKSKLEIIKSMRPSGRYMSVKFEIQQLSFKNVNLKMSSPKHRPFIDLNLLKDIHRPPKVWHNLEHK